MLVMRNHPKGARFASFGIGLCVFALMPNEIGYQDIASLLARQPGVAERWQRRASAPGAPSLDATYRLRRRGRAFPAASAKYLFIRPAAGATTAFGCARTT